MLAVSCNKTSENEVAEPVPVIIDGDWGSSTDDLFALDVLEKAADEGLVDIKAVMADREGAAKVLTHIRTVAKKMPKNR